MTFQRCSLIDNATNYKPHSHSAFHTWSVAQCALPRKKGTDRQFAAPCRSYFIISCYCQMVKYIYFLTTTWKITVMLWKWQDNDCVQLNENAEKFLVAQKWTSKRFVLSRNFTSNTMKKKLQEFFWNHQMHFPRIKGSKIKLQYHS